MKIKYNTINEAFSMPSFFKEVLNEKQFCILDIETTGLSSKYHNVILIGLLYPQNNQTVVKQIFADNPIEEEELLLQFSEEMKKFKYFITYNGVAFDYPFLKERFKKYNIPWEHDEVNHFDILYLLRKCKSQLPLDNLKLKTVENYLGITRSDTISGKDSVELYKNYVLAPSPSLEKTILLHNYEDIYYLAKVAGIFDHLPSLNSLMGKSFLNITVGSYDISLLYHPNDISIKRNNLQISGKTTKLLDLPEEVHYTPYFDFQWVPKEGIFRIEIPLQRRILPTKEKLYYLNLKEFEPIFTTSLVEDEYKAVFQEYLMEVDLSSHNGLISVIDLLNSTINHVLQDNKMVPAT